MIKYNLGTIEKNLKVALKESGKVLYRGSSPLFAWVSPPVGGLITQITGGQTCRESFIGSLRNNYHNSKNQSVRGTTERISNRKLRFLFFIRHTKGEYVTKNDKTKKFDDAWMKEATRILNVFEKDMNWTKTTIKNVKNITIRRNYCDVYLIEGPANWLRAAPLISLYTLLLRSSKYSSIYKKFKTLKDCNKLTFYKKYRTSSDYRHVKNSYKYWQIIMNNYEYLFNFRPFSQSTPRLMGTEGITHYVQSSYKGVLQKYDSWTDNAAGERWNKFRKKNQDKLPQE